MVCRGICHRYKASKSGSTDGRYENGQKRCQSCEIFIIWDGLRCPCCSQRLRLRSRIPYNKLSPARKIEI